MSETITNVLLWCMGLYGLIVIVELALTRAVKRFLIQVAAIAVLFLLLRVTTGFPTPKTAFGGVSPVVAIGVMFLCTVLGIAARYLFYLRGPFSWGAFLKPLVISPMVLLPLIGSVQGASQVESIQLISFGVLSFQNGFFWRVVLEHARTQLTTQGDATGAAAAAAE